MNREIEVVLFDATETLIHLPRGVGAHYAEEAAKFGYRIEAAKMQAAFKHVFRTMPARVSQGERRADDDRGWWRELVFRVLAEGAPAGFPRGEYFDRVYDLFADPAVWALYPEVLPALDALRGQFRLGVLSNFDGRLRSIFDGLGVTARFEHLIISSEVGADKPHPRIFQIALERFAVAPAQVIHVGDHPELDWRAAEQAGLHAYALQRPERSLMELAEMLLAGGEITASPERSARRHR